MVRFLAEVSFGTHLLWHGEAALHQVNQRAGPNLGLDSSGQAPGPHFSFKLFGEDICACGKTQREVRANPGNDAEAITRALDMHEGPPLGSLRNMGTAKGRAGSFFDPGFSQADQNYLMRFGDGSTVPVLGHEAYGGKVNRYGTGEFSSSDHEKALMSLMEIYNTDTPNGKEVELAKTAYLDQQPGPSPLRTYNNSRAHGPGFPAACSRLYRSLPTPVSHLVHRFFRPRSRPAQSPRVPPSQVVFVSHPRPGSQAHKALFSAPGSCLEIAENHRRRRAKSLARNLHEKSGGTPFPTI